MFRPYPKTKYSGVEWLCKVPEHWGIKPLKHVVGLINEKAETTDGEYIGLENIESFTGRLTPSSSEVDQEGTATLFRAADVLFGKLRPYLAKAIIAKVDGRCSSELLVLRPLGTIPSFLLYQVLSDHFIRIVDSSTYGTKMPRANWDFIGKMPVPVPDIVEQRAIASFLDHKTALIDDLIAKRERQIELLQEQRTALISRAVSKGPNPDVPMKDSGVEWLGKVPEHWRVAPVYSRYEVQLGKMLDEKQITGKHLAPYLRNIDVQWDRVNVIDLPLMDFDPGDRQRFSLRSGDLLVCEGGEIGRAAIWEGDLEECYYQKALHRVRPYSDRDVPRFFFYVLYAASKNDAFIVGGNQTTIGHLTAEKLRKHRFAFPSRKEQEEIAAVLDRETAKIGTFVSKIQQSIEKLMEYRKSLISAAVTGKIDVRSFVNKSDSRQLEMEVAN